MPSSSFRLNSDVKTVSLDTAVLFLVFNRPDTTERVFEAIRQARPPRLYVAADGAREGKVGEVEIVTSVRNIATRIDWPCELKTLFRTKNYGCGRAVSEAITWFFDQEECGIILEDDCLPSQSFFKFCEVLLDKYRDDRRISIISGYNKQNTWKAKECDYFFSNFGGIWGWASWKRAWEYYDADMSSLDQMVSAGRFESLLGCKLGPIRKQQLMAAREGILSGELDTWDYQWALSRHLQRGIACVPSKSMIENIGFGPGGTHTLCAESDGVSHFEIEFPISINSQLEPDIDYDLRFLGYRSKLDKVKSVLNRISSVVLRKKQSKKPY